VDATVLIVDDDEHLRTALGVLVRTLGHEAVEAPDVAAAQSLLLEREIELVISDLRMPGGSGLDLLAIVQRLDLDAPVILLTAYGTVEGAVEAMQQGAFDYLQKPFDAEEMKLRIGRALAARRNRIESAFLRTEREQSHGFDDLIGVSQKLRAVADLVRRVAPSEAAVLVTGETGTGKELIARAIHRRSSRQDRLLIPVNLAAIPLDLLESELFGHARGAFTGAVVEREGKLELADGGTLFLDEVGETPVALQPKLLRVLQDGVVERVGSNRRREVSIRLVSATNRDLEESIRVGQFRRDLFYRIRVVEIAIPPLRERREDIPYLVAHFLRRFVRAGHQVPSLTEGALRLLESYSWPGNVRELENIIERAVVLCHGGTIGAGLLDLRQRGAASSEPGTIRLDEAMDRLEREMILRALDETRQVKARAARLLGVSERSLWYKLRKHGLP
jgi:two-component system, NtrC family, response regulator AtoC